MNNFFHLFYYPSPFYIALFLPCIIDGHAVGEWHKKLQNFQDYSAKKRIVASLLMVVQGIIFLLSIAIKSVVNLFNIPYESYFDNAAIALSYIYCAFYLAFLLITLYVAKNENT
ncbi:hypothetical protein [Baaleninema simplex]|uniref:hypothetical protein n=1 Tax=Baaleninema simplex TaxID=2862350 RepID=UPI000360DD53|nr:hypothetical protein [Baaleninema simplex]